MESTVTEWFHVAAKMTCDDPEISLRKSGLEKVLMLRPFFYSYH